MGACELVEPACASPLVFVAVDRSEGVVDNAVSEGLVERAMEPLSSLCISSQAIGRGEDDSGAKVVAQQRLCANSGVGVVAVGIEDGSRTNGCTVSLKCAENTEASIEMADLELTDGPGEAACDGLGERVDELVVVPLSGLYLSSKASRSELDHSSEEGFCNLDHSSGTVETSDGTVGDFCRGAACNNTDSVPIIERHDVRHGSSNNDPELGNGSSDSSINCRLNRICIDEGLCDGGMSICLTNLTVEGEGALQIQEVASGPSGSARLCMEDANRADDTRNNNDDMNADMVKCADTCPLPLRRSSRSRKTIQQVQRGKPATRCKKKPPKDSHPRVIDLLSEATRKKRSSYSRSKRLSGWGTSENVAKYLHFRNKVAVNQVMDQRARKKKGSENRGKKAVLNVVKTSASAEGKQEISCRPIRLKVTFGKKEESGKGDNLPPPAVNLPGLQPGNDNPLSFCSNVETSGGNVKDSSVSKEIPRLMQCRNFTSSVQFTASNRDLCSEPGKSSHDDSSRLDFEKQDGSCADKFSDPGTSPDSEVIDQILDSTTRPRALPSLHNFVDKESHGNAGHRSLSFSTKKSKNRRNKKDKLCRTSIPSLECQLSADGSKMSEKDGELQKPSDDFLSCDNIIANSENHPSNDSDSELDDSMELLPVGSEVSNRILSLDDGTDSNTYSVIIIGLESTSGNSCKSFPSAGRQGKKNCKGSKTKGKVRNKSKSIDESRLQKDASSQHKSKKKFTGKHKARETGISCDAYEIRDQPGTGNLEKVDVSKSEFSKEVALENTSCLDLIHTGIAEQTLVPRVAWVCCDDCLKWRCIPAVLADAIEATNCRWTCKDNQDKAFGDCSIPQEKSNAEINSELQISDEEDARDGHFGSKGSGLKPVLASQPSTWMLVKSNLFLHRSRKAQTMDEIMVCHCKPPVDGNLGCGSHCLNRMLNIECVQGTCPCGDLCSNQQFQRKQYAKLSWLRCGKKGYGLQVLEDISEGQFLIEYVGEVLDLQTYEARQKEYASKGHKHFYFMTLNGNEVIDASAKGNLGRFVNHSCDPNCRTEKWVVNGEICVGLFALRSIKKGEELTFDYNYVRVFGAAAKKCHCGSRKCRGYIGGDPHNAEIIVQGDSDEEFPEPVVVNENGDIDHSLGDLMAKASSQDVEEVVNGKKLSKESSEIIVEGEEIINKTESSIDDCGPIQGVSGKDSVDEVRESTDSSSGFQHEHWRSEPASSVKIHTSSTEHTIGTPTSSPKSDVLHVENASQKSLSGSIDSASRVSEVDTECEPHSGARPRMKISRPSKSVKNRKSSCNVSTVGRVLSKTQRPKVFSCKPKRLLEGSANGHLKDVEENLNELLDADGGICKKKDSSKGYLKLLLLTAASGDSGNGGAIQSNRILSMILDAMLKTKSRGVLLDIINKNGLQMLHNMMKLYRRDFKKIPILRKLLKVLEFLAEKEILTVERINVDSLHPGVESFRESILYFTEHDDFQVHQIARSFRDRWIPHARKFHRLEMSDRRREFRRVSNSSRHFGSCHHWREQGATAVERLNGSDPSGSMSNLADARSEEASSPKLVADQTMVNRPRKRKSRWDQPASPRKTGRIPKVDCSGGGQRTLTYEAKKEESNCSGDQNILRHRDEDMMHNLNDEAPPGFSHLQDSTDDTPPGFSSVLCPMPLGLPQTRFNPHLPVAYGIPFSVIQKSGTPQCGTADSWTIAPAMPFQPFPPLPPYPRDKRPIEDQEEVRQGYQTHAGDEGLPCTSDASKHTAETNQHMVHHERGPRNFLGKRCYWQRNWNGSKRRPPWARNIGRWGFRGNYPSHPRHGSSNINMEMVPNESSGEDVPEVNHSVDYAGNSC